MTQDEFFWLCTINRATVVVGLQNGQFDRSFAEKAAHGISAVEILGAKDPTKRVKSYIAWEPLFIETAGPEVTAIHAGRSSQDILSTQRCALLRTQLLDFENGLDDVINDLLTLADKHRNTIVPSYTNGVAAQPTTYAHTLLGVVQSLLRVRERAAQCFVRLNHCSMGATVLNGTGWPLDREAMARALGFPSPVDNALDATSLAPVDLPLEIASCLASAAIRIGAMINDMMVQYAQPRPWILLQEGGDNTYISSAMPQKRNPGLMNNCREDCSDVIGEMNSAFLRAHNVMPGMVDGKRVEKNARMMAAAMTMIERFRKVLAGLTINSERALEELNNDWTASQEIADRLMRNHGLPFRIGHHAASRMVGFARKNNILPRHFDYADMQRIYREEITEEFPEGPAEFPMTEKEFREALDPRKIIEARRTLGSTSPAEIDRMIHEARNHLNSFINDRNQARKNIENALERLSAEFNKLL